LKKIYSDIRKIFHFIVCRVKGCGKCYFFCSKSREGGLVKRLSATKLS